jgi:hypothetical protein
MDAPDSRGFRVANALLISGGTHPRSVHHMVHQSIPRTYRPAKLKLNPRNGTIHIHQH